MCSWQVAVPFQGPWACPLIIMRARAADPLAAVVVEGDRLLPLASMSCSLSMSSISRNDMSGLDAVARGTSPSCRRRWGRSGARRAVSVALLVAPGGQLHVLELERLPCAASARCPHPSTPTPPRRRSRRRCAWPRRPRLVLHAEVAAARLLAVQRVAAHQLAELDEVGDAAGLLERLVERRRPMPGTFTFAPELLAQLPGSARSPS